MVKTNSLDNSMSIARLAGVQSLYESEISGITDDEIIFDFLTRRWSEINNEWSESTKPNKTKFSSLVRGVKIEKSSLDEIIAGAVDKNRKFERLDILLKSILRAGTFELLREPNVPLAVVINEYVLITHAFYFENEASFVNAVLDSIGKSLRTPTKSIQ